MPKTYSNTLKDPRWQRKRLEVMERDKWTCRDTGKSDETLAVHHCWYAKGGPWETPKEFLLTLSEDAHKKRQELEGRAKKALGLIMASSCLGGPDDDCQRENALTMLVESLEHCAAHAVKEEWSWVIAIDYNLLSSCMDEIKEVIEEQGLAVLPEILNFYSRKMAPREGGVR